MKRAMNGAAHDEQRLDHMANAGAEAVRLVQDAALRGIDAAMLCAVFAQVLAARNPTLAGKVLMAVEMQLQAYPITKILDPNSLN